MTIPRTPLTTSQTPNWEDELFSGVGPLVRGIMWRPPPAPYSTCPEILSASRANPTREAAISR